MHKYVTENSYSSHSCRLQFEKSCVKKINKKKYRVDLNGKNIFTILQVTSKMQFHIITSRNQQKSNFIFHLEVVAYYLISTTSTSSIRN